MSCFFGLCFVYVLEPLLSFILHSNIIIIFFFFYPDCKLDQTSQIDIQTKKKSHGKKITGFQVILHFSFKLCHPLFSSDASYHKGK
jgi:hypothetical protein